MSVVIGLVTNNCASVASDGRIIHNNRIISDKRDKTFCINNSDIIGCYAGLMTYCGLDIHDHLNNYYQNHLNIITLKERIHFTVFDLYLHLKTCNLTNRNIDITFAIKEKTRFILLCYRIQIDVNGACDFEIWPDVYPPVNGVAWMIWGNNSTFPSIRTYLNACQNVNHTRASLTQLSEYSIQIGIGNCSANTVGLIDCGGNIYSRTIV